MKCDFPFAWQIYNGFVRLADTFFGIAMFYFKNVLWVASDGLEHISWVLFPSNFFHSLEIGESSCCHDFSHILHVNTTSMIAATFSWILWRFSPAQKTTKRTQRQRPWRWRRKRQILQSQPKGIKERNETTLGLEAGASTRTTAKKQKICSKTRNRKLNSKLCIFPGFDVCSLLPRSYLADRTNI